jgi:hypothetical protein
MFEKFRKFNDLEKSIQEKFKKVKENEVSLTNEDFKNGRLTIAGFTNLKQQCEYIPYKQDIEIIVPEGCKNGFKTSLENMSASELSRIRKERNFNRRVALVLLFAGIMSLILGNILTTVWSVPEGFFINEIILIASWVFVWGAVERWFFGGNNLRGRRTELLHILSAKVKYV